MLWLVVIIIAYFLNACVSLIDKYLLSGRIGKPTTYAFYVGLLGLLSVFLIPFGGLVLPSLKELFINLFAGAIFVIALIVYYHSLQLNEPSRVVPVVGSFQIVFIFLLSYIFLGERLSPKFLLAFFLFLIGSILISIRKTKYKRRLTYKFLLTILSAFIFAIFYVMTKYIYIHQPFISGFIWSRIGGAIMACLLLVFPQIRKSVFQTSKNAKKKIGSLFIFNQAISGFSFVLVNFAISLTSVTLVNSLQGIQYVFIFLISLFLARHKHILVEEVNKWIIIQKTIAIALIGSGIFLIVV